MTADEAISILYKMDGLTFHSGERGMEAVKMAEEALCFIEKLPKWKKVSYESCWSGEIGVNPSKRQFVYEHYAINADKLFKILLKEG